jgi:hypothetical protein
VIDRRCPIFWAGSASSVRLEKRHDKLEKCWVIGWDEHSDNQTSQDLEPAVVNETRSVLWTYVTDEDTEEHSAHGRNHILPWITRFCSSTSRR